MIPGLWLDASSWDDVLPPLRAAGLRPRPLTMPGLGAPGDESAGIGIADWVAAAVAAIDESAGPVAVVGHSGGGNVAWGAADARPERVTRVVLVDTAVPHDGGMISEFDVVDGVVPFPGWDFFDENDVADLDAQTRARTAPLTRSGPHRRDRATRRTSLSGSRDGAVGLTERRGVPWLLGTVGPVCRRVRRHR